MSVAWRWGAVALVAASASYAQTPAWNEEPVEMAAGKGSLRGTLLVPTGTPPVPLVVIIAGSGPTDRDGNSGPLKTNNLKQLAEALAERGIASVRYDKRGIAASAGAATAESELRFDMYADDAAAWARRFRSDARFSTVVIVGHSEGSLLGMLATSRGPADGLVSIAGVARRADAVLHDQLAASLPPQLLAQADSISASLVAGKTVESPPYLAALFRPSVQPYIISWFKYQGSVEIAKLRAPVLIVQGTSDIQVAPSEADSLAAALPSARKVVFPGMNHVLRITPPGRAEQMPSYSDPTLPLAAGLADSVAAFVKSVKRCCA